MKIKFLIGFILIALLVSCNMGNSSDGNSEANKEKGDIEYNSNMTKILCDIADASHIYIGSATSESRGYSEQPGVQRLFKITKDGYTEEVEFTDPETGKRIKNINTPNELIRMSDTYLYIDFGGSGYLLNVKDGIAYKFNMIYGENGFDLQEYDKKKYNILNDQEGNIYYITYIKDCDYDKKRVSKINVANPDKIYHEFITPTPHFVNCFGVDKNGNLMYAANSTGGVKVLKLRTRNGEFKDLSPVSIDKVLWQNFYGDLYGFINGTLCKIKIESDDVQYVSILEKTKSSRVNIGEGELTILVKNKDMTVIFDGISFYQIYNETDEVSVHSINEFNISRVLEDNYVSVNNCVYLMCLTTNNKISVVKINLDDYTCSDIFEKQNYEIFKITGYQDGILFNALDNSNGNELLGKVDSKNNITVLENNFNQKITVLEKIN